MENLVVVLRLLNNDNSYRSFLIKETIEEIRFKFQEKGNNIKKDWKMKMNDSNYYRKLNCFSSS